jgi:oxygen-independent coproporphyrinogen-3 oxidase
VDVVGRFRAPLDDLTGEGFLTVAGDRISLSREGLLRVDSLLPRFFKPEHATIRYT